MSTHITNKDIVVVIPTKNEEEGIGPVIEGLHEALNGTNYAIIVVDANSADKTAQIAKTKGAEVIQQKGTGYGDAYIQGFKHAIKKYNPKTLVMIDGDATYDPHELPKLLAALEEADMVLGYRFANMEPGAMTTTNKIGNKILSWLACTLIGLNVKDTQSGYRAIKREIIELANLREKGMPFATELLVEAYSYGFNITEVPITYRKRAGGKSKLNPVKDGIRILKTIIHFALRYNPVSAAFTLASLLLIPGIALGAYVAYRYITTGALHYMKGLAAISVTSAGFTSLLLAILAVYLKRMEYRIQRRMHLLIRR